MVDGCVRFAMQECMLSVQPRCGRPGLHLRDVIVSTANYAQEPRIFPVPEQRGGVTVPALFS